MKKTILIVLVLALLAPVAAFGATEFSLGGFIKLDTFWDSTQNTKNSLVVIQRNNDQLFHHGLFGMTAQGSRFNFTIKGPQLWGATTTGFIEMDFDGTAGNAGVNIASAPGDGRVSNTSSYIPRLRHAMFRLNWPETELMFGQYWGMFSEFAPETSGDATYMFHGWTFQRTPQIRLTQKFAGAWTIAGSINKPYDPALDASTFDGQTVPAGSTLGTTAGLLGQSSETPQLQGKLAYEKDLWGKAPFYGRPRGFTAQLNAGWQRTRYRANTAGATFLTFGDNAFGQTAAANSFQNGQQYLDPWMVQGTLFIPVIPCINAPNMAGSASITAEYFIGQGVAFLGAGRDQDATSFRFGGINAAGQRMFTRTLTQQWGGYLQGQYWFTNQWYLTAIWGFTRNYGFDQGTNPLAVTATNPNGHKYATALDQTKLWSEYDLTLWYRPIEAIKFGLTYAYERTDFLQKVNNPPIVGAVQNNAPQFSAGAKDFGESHRIQFVAFMFF